MNSHRLRTEPTNIELLKTGCHTEISASMFHSCQPDVLNFPPEIFSSIYGLYFTCIYHISSKIVLSSLNLFLVRADEWQMRMLSAKLGCIGQAVSGKLRVTLKQ